MSWTPPSPSQLLDDDGSGCERALIMGANNIMYSSEPQGKQRTSMTISCSTDYGQTWAYSRGVNGDSPGAYSDLVSLNSDTLLIVWEDGTKGNFYAAQVGTDWCGNSKFKVPSTA
jgi:hypothetical protein